MQAEALNDAAMFKGYRAPLHLKLDTGMGRIGFPSEEASVSEIIKISKLPNIHIEGIFSHLANADMEGDRFTEKQSGVFSSFAENLRKQALKYLSIIWQTARPQ